MLGALKKFHVLFFIAAVIVFVIAFLIRIQPFLRGDFFFLLDQSRDMVLVKDIVISHKLPLIGARAGFGGLFHGPLWLYMIAPFFILSHGNPFFSLVPLFLLVSIVIVIAGFFIGVKLYGYKIGIIFAILLALSAPLIDSVQFTTNAEVMPFVFLVFLYCALEFIRGKNIFFVFMCFLAGVGMHFESAFAVFLLPLTFLAVVIRWKKIPFQTILLGIGAFLVAVSNFILFDLRHKFLMTHAVLSLLLQHQQPIKGFERYASITFRIQDRLLMFRDAFFLPIFNQNIFISLLVVVCVVVGFVFFLRKWILEKKLDKEFLFIFLIPFIIYSAYVFYPFPLWGHYTISIAIFSVVILVLSFKNILMIKRGYLLVLLFTVLITVQTVQWIFSAYPQTYVSKEVASSSDGSFINQLAVAEWIFNDAKQTPFGYFVYNPQVLTYNMDYLLWFEGTKHHVAFSNQKHEITYLIMYGADPKDVHAHDFWKKNVVRTNGSVISSIILPGNITIEKLRIASNEAPADPNYYQNLTFR